MRIGLIGGSGLYDWPELTQQEWLTVETPWGAPSDAILTGELAGQRVFFLPRHGRGHVLLPLEINHRANLWALKQAGVEAVIGISAVGSLREDIRPRDVLMPDQYFDRTRSTPKHTFFGNGVVGHIAFGDPVCPTLHGHLLEAARTTQQADPEFADRTVHAAGTYVNMEGPAFSTRAESKFYRSQGFDIIGMTSLAEAKLAREAELPYALLALITDYDCWHQGEGEVSADLVASHVRANQRFAQAILHRLIEHLPANFPSPARTALQGAIMTEPTKIPAATRQKIPWLP
jgi:5'-methylthioadenosine phosphorylase